MSSLGISHPTTSDPILKMQEIVRQSTKVHVCGSQTKSGFHPLADGVTIISTQSLQGIVSYDPQEFVVTMLSGTRISDVVAILAKQGQYLPFDPLLHNRGATVGGTVAANASGPGRFRFGGIRDFLIGVRFIDGRGNCIRGGGQVVKNAAGFDYPKLMVGSQGKLGLIYELTFKVFPRPESYATVLSWFSELDQALMCMNKLASSPMDLEAIDLIPVEGDEQGYDLAIRIGGIATAIPNRSSRLQKLVPASRVLIEYEDEMFWRAASNFDWARNSESLLKLPMTPRTIPAVEKLLANSHIDRRYSVGGNVGWIATEWTSDLQAKLGNVQHFFGQPSIRFNSSEPGPFGQAIRRALDPALKFG